MKFPLTLLTPFLFTTALSAAETVDFNARTAQSGKWSHAQTWDGGRKPQAGARP